MKKNLIAKKTWTKPVIHRLKFNQTFGGFWGGHGENDWTEDRLTHGSLS